MASQSSAQSSHESSPDPAKEINILLLGESGVGKSTFINSCFNYLKYTSLKDLIDNELQVLIPAKIQMEDMNYQQQTINLKVNYEPDELDDANEVMEDGKAATQDVHTYIFSIYVSGQRYKVRFLDTPGMGDNRGAQQDQLNCDLILDYISHLKEIHAFCILLKPLNSRLDVFMNYCVVQILSRLESSAVNNVAFILTHTRGQNFTPGHTYTPLKVLLDNIRKNNNLSIPLGRANVFCFDNESFRYVAAIKNGVQLQPFIYRNTEDSWNYSTREFWRFLGYISQQKPHDLKKTISVNDARTMASHLTQPVTEIVQLIQDNITKLEQHSNELSEAKLTKEELVKKMHTPIIDIEVQELEYPHTVCTDPDCTSDYEVNGIRKTHYKQKCCSQCMVTFVSPDIVGNIALYLCSAFGWNAQCKECPHYLAAHKHIYYETNVFEKEVDETMLPDVRSQEELVEFKENLIRSLSERQREFEYERQYILKSCAILDQYLKKNTVTPIGNPIEDYLKYQITRESTFRHGADDETVNTLRRLLAQYEKEKTTVQGGRSAQNQSFTPDEIEEIKHRLMTLKHYGPKIKKLYNLHQTGARKTFRKKEKVVKGGVGEFFKQIQDLFGLGNAAIQLGGIPTAISQVTQYAFK